MTSALALFYAKHPNHTPPTGQSTNGRPAAYSPGPSTPAPVAPQPQAPSGGGTGWLTAAAPAALVGGTG